jgi:serine/threonine protein phosphatase PrpC
VVIGVAQRPAEGETLCGDAYAIVRRGRRTLVALADGLGHGPEAARAAQAFCSHVQAAADRPLDAILTTAGPAIAGTRGVAAALLRLDPPGHFEYAGVGNIVLRVLSRTPIHPLSVAGTLGRRNARRVRCDRFAVEEGDLLVMHSDGVSGRYELDRLRGAAPDRVARELLAAHGRSHDDATCLVVRWDGVASPPGGAPEA